MLKGQFPSFGANLPIALPGFTVSDAVERKCFDLKLERLYGANKKTRPLSSRPRQKSFLFPAKKRPYSAGFFRKVAEPAAEKKRPAKKSGLFTSTTRSVMTFCTADRENSRLIRSETDVIVLDNRPVSSGFLASIPLVVGSKLRSFSASNTALGDATLEMLAKCCPGLSLIDVSGCYKCTAEAVLAFLEGVPSLRAIRLARNAQLFRGDIGLKLAAVLGRRMSTVLELDLNGTGFEAIHAVEMLKSMKEGAEPESPRKVRLAWSSSFSEKATPQVTPKRCPMKKLDLSGCRVGSKDLIPILSRCPRLKTLKLAQAPKGEHSEEHDSEQITDALLLCLGLCCPSLESADFSGCTCITDGGVGSLTDGCVSLKSLRFNLCTQLSGTTARLLAIKAPSLIKADLTGCLGLDTVSVNLLLRRSSNLRLLFLSLCPLLTDAEIDAMRGEHPKVKIVRHAPSLTNPLAGLDLPGFRRPPPEKMFRHISKFLRNGGKGGTRKTATKRRKHR